MAAGMAEVAKATVTIIPTMEGSQAIISKELGAAAEPAGDSAGDTAGNSFGAKFVSTVKKVVTAAAIGKTITSSLTAGADLQQSIGGVETLFGDSADKVKEYAKEAYETTGMSANTYMENVTGFSASLLQSLSGDTEAAAEYANTAMVDMSDNANKMGTDIENITNAYQGFAKQNYTMLDNLKLGYGGTQDEMERLLADAQELSGVEYSIDSFADIVAAIHVIQEDMGIAGTTAKEASETFSGSLASMKAAGENLLANLSLGEDITPSLQALLSTLTVFAANNLLPMLGNIFTGLPAILPYVVTGAKELVAALVPQIPEILSGIFDSLGQAASEMLAALGLSGEQIEAFSNAWAGLKDGIKTAIDMFSQFMEWLNGGTKGAEAFKAAVLAIVTGFAAFKAVSGTISKVKTAISGVKTAFSAFSAVLSANPIALIIAAIAALAAGIIYLWNNCEWFRDGVIAVWEKIKSAWAVAVDFFGGVKEGITGAFQGVQEWFANTFGGAWESIKSAWSSVTSWFSGIWEAIGSNPILSGLIDIIAMPFKNAWTAIKTVWDVVAGFFSGIWGLITGDGTLADLWSKVSQPFVDAWDSIKGNWDGVANFFTGIWDSVSNNSTLSGLLDVISAPFKTAWVEIKTVWDVVAGFFSGIWGLITGDGDLTDLWSKVSQPFSDAWDSIKGIWEPVVQFFQNIWDGITGVFADVKGWFSGIFGGTGDTVSESVGDMTGWASGAWESITGFFGNAASTIGGWFSGISLPSAEDISGFAGEAWTNITDALGTAGEKISGFFDGINISDKVAAVSDWAGEAWTDIKEAFGDVSGWFSETFGNVGTTVSNAVGDVASWAEETWGNVKDAANSVGGWFASLFGWGSEDDAAAAVTETNSGEVGAELQQEWADIEASIAANCDAINEKTASTFETVQSSAETAFGEILNTASTTWESIKNSIIDPITEAREKIKSELNTISRAFSSCKLTLPHIKLPHFSISGSFSLETSSVPSVAVDWYKTGGILTRPTIFGALNGTLLGGGDGGAEAVLPLSGFYRQLETIMSGQAGGVSVQVMIDRFENNSNQDVEDFARTVAEEIQAQTERRRAAL